MPGETSFAVVFIRVDRYCMRIPWFEVSDCMRKVRFKIRDCMRNARLKALSREGVWLGSEVGVEVDVGSV